MQDLGLFLDFMYGEETGYAYSPTKNPDPDNPVFEQYFFHWPTEKEQLISHIQTKTQSHEVYFGPALYSSDKDAEKDSFKGTNVVWVEFDGNDPANVSDIPEPAIKIQSSTDKHEHWYWKLDHFVEDINIVEDITGRLAYHLNADLGCWNANRVLRPPGTRHHESGLTVTTFRWDLRPTAIRSFNELPAVPVKLLKTSDINHVPAPLEVIAKYSFADRMEDFKFFMTPKIEKGHRSDALAKLGHICMELSMTNAETLALLLNADNRWGKYKDRKDQKARLLGIINYCRSKHPVDAVGKETEVEKRLVVYNYDEFINTEIKLEWVIEGLIHRKGLAILSGPPDVGKSQVSLRFAEKLATGSPFLQWPIPKPMRILFVSMEMPHEELHYLVDNMQFNSDKDLLRENFLVLPLGYGIRLGNKAAQAELAAVVEEFMPDGIIFDSFGVGIGDDINSEKVILEALDYVHRVLRGGFGAFVWFIHHNRKPQVGNKAPKKLEDLFGSQYIGAAVTTGICLWPTKPGGPIEVSNIKLRMAKKFETFYVQRTQNLDFQVFNGQVSQDKDQQIFTSGVGFEL
jgi:hypothetical protein